MRFVGLLLTAALLASCLAGEERPAGVRADGGPVLSLDRDSHDFGKVSADGEAVTTFTIRNTGAGPLHISRVMTGCCLDAELSSKEIDPGSSATLTVTLKRLLGRKGRYEPALWIHSNDTIPQRRIQLTAFIEVSGGPAGTGI